MQANSTTCNLLDCLALSINTLRQMDDFRNFWILAVGWCRTCPCCQIAERFPPWRRKSLMPPMQRPHAIETFSFEGCNAETIDDFRNVHDSRLHRQFYLYRHARHVAGPDEPVLGTAEHLLRYRRLFQRFVLVVLLLSCRDARARFRRRCRSACLFSLGLYG